MNTLREAIDAAKTAIVRHGYKTPATVTECRVRKTSRKTSFNFRFHESQEIGHEIANGDGSVSVVRAVVNP